MRLRMPRPRFSGLLLPGRHQRMQSWNLETAAASAGAKIDPMDSYTLPNGARGIEREDFAVQFGDGQEPGRP
jgi:hypothetical protein